MHFIIVLNFIKGCDEPVLIISAPGNISSPNFPSSYPPSVDCITTISLDTRIQLTFQLLFILPDTEDYVTISELGENGYEERVVSVVNFS